MHEIILLVTGFLVGSMNAIAGGGMLLGFPILMALGVPPIVANATAAVATAPGQVMSAIGYRNYLRKVQRRYAWLILPLIAGSLVGALTLRNTSHEHFEKLIPLLLLFGVALLIFQPLLHFHLHSHLKGRSKRLLPLVLVGLAVIPIAFYGAYFGAGYGLLMLAFLGFTSLHDSHLMNALKNVSAIFVSGVAVMCLLNTGLIDWSMGAIMAAGAMAGGYLGSRAALHVSNHAFRIVVIVIGVGAVAYLALQQY